MKTIKLTSKILPIILAIHCWTWSTLTFATEEAVIVAAESDSVLSAAPERRKAQFQTSFGYALFPYPYSIPGIGSGLSLVGGAMNIKDTYTDVYGIAFSGDVEGMAAGVADLHLIPRTLVLDLGFSGVNKASFMSYSSRGMDTNKDDYRLIELGNSDNYGGRLTATFLDRRFELYGGWYESSSKLQSIRDKDGNIIVQAQDAARIRSISTFIGTRIDLTDDYSDPRRGVRLDISRYANPPTDSGPDFAVMDYNLTGYLPMGSRNTWVFNFLRSDAIVSRQGVTDPLVIQQQNGIDCSTLTGSQQQYCLEVVNNIIAANTYGSATSLGGLSRLRSFSQSRFTGAHTQFYGTEFRWNLTDEATPFDIFVMKDIRTSLQVAVFCEIGSTADLQQDVGKTWRNSYGTGLRMVTASGVVFRADIATGQDGVATQIFIGYPWEIF
jgi:hypothetical protein